MIATPALRFVMQGIEQDMDHRPSIDLEFLRGAFCQNDVSRDRVRGGEANRRLNPERLSEAHHRVVKALLDILEVARLEQLVVVDLVSVDVPAIKEHEGVDLLDKFVLDGTVLVHMQVLDRVIDADLGRGHGRHVYKIDVVQHKFVTGVPVQGSVDVFTLAQQDREEVSSDLSCLNLRQLGSLDAVKLVCESIDIGNQGSVARRDVVPE